jgi:ankyrin repeat protein
MLSPDFIVECIEKTKNIPSNEPEKSLVPLELTEKFPNCFVGCLTPDEKIIYGALNKIITENDYIGASSVLNLILTQDSKEKIVNKLLLDSCTENNSLTLTFLLGQGANIDCYNNLPFITACRYGNINLMITFMDHGIKPNMVPDAFIAAALNGQKEVISELVKNGLNVNINNCEALKLCVLKGLTDMVEFLLELGIDPSSHIDRLLIIVLNEKHYDIAKILINIATDSFLMDKHITTAKNNNMNDFVQLFEKRKNELQKSKNRHELHYYF